MVSTTTPKPTSRWDESISKYFNIEFASTNPVDFFGVDPAALPDADLPRAILTEEVAPPSPSKEVRIFFELLWTSRARASSRIIPFYTHLLSLLGYDEPDAVIIPYEKGLAFTMCDDRHVPVFPKLVVVRPFQEYLALLHHVEPDEEGFVESERAPHELVAQAIAIRVVSDELRVWSGLERRPDGDVLGIVIAGDMPCFYRIPVPPSLARCVSWGVQPEETTVVKFCRLPDCSRKGPFEKPEQRRFTLKYFQAFQKLMKPSVKATLPVTVAP